MRERAGWRRRAFAELEADPRFDRFRRRAGRRGLLAIHLVWGALGYALVGMAADLPVGWLAQRIGDTGAVATGVAAVLVWTAGFVVLTGWLNASVGGVTELPYAVLDEAQTAVRRRAEADGHRVVRVVLFLIGLWAVASLGFRYGLRTGGGAAEAAPTVLLAVPAGWWTWAMVAIAATASLLALLPLYLLAWRLPDDVLEPAPLESAA